MRGGREKGGVRKPPIPFNSPSPLSPPPNPPKIHMPRKKKNTSRFFISESKHLGHGGLEVMGKEETIGLIRPGHTSPAEINQKSLHYWAPPRLTLVLPTQLSAGELWRARSLPTRFPRLPAFQPGRSADAEGEPALCSSPLACRPFGNEPLGIF